MTFCNYITYNLPTYLSVFVLYYTMYDIIVNYLNRTPLVHGLMDITYPLITVIYEIKVFFPYSFLFLTTLKKQDKTLNISDKHNIKNLHIFVICIYYDIFSCVKEKNVVNRYFLISLIYMLTLDIYSF